MPSILDYRGKTTKPGFTLGQMQSNTRPQQLPRGGLYGPGSA
jgi:hypothetical protein